MTNKQQNVLLGDIAHIFSGVPTKSSEQNDEGTERNVITVHGLGETEFDRSGLTAVDFGKRGVDRYRVQAGDVLLPSRSTSLRTVIVPEDMDGRIISGNIICIRLQPVLHPRILVAILNSPEGVEAIMGSSQSTTIQLNLTVKGLRDVQIPLIPIDEQQQLAELLEATDAAYHNAVQAAETRRILAREIVSQRLTGKSRGNND